MLKVSFIFVIYLFLNLLFFKKLFAGSEIEKLNERITNLEIITELNRFNFTGTMINQFESFNTRYTPSTEGNNQLFP